VAAGAEKGQKKMSPPSGKEDLKVDTEETQEGGAIARDFLPKAKGGRVGGKGRVRHKSRKQRGMGRKKGRDSTRDAWLLPSGGGFQNSRSQRCGSNPYKVGVVQTETGPVCHPMRRVPLGREGSPGISTKHLRPPSERTAGAASAWNSRPIQQKNNENWQVRER